MTALCQWNTLQGVFVERYAYDAFGNVRFLTPGLIPLGASRVGNTILFTGRRWDGESGLYDYRARMYNPALGRFLQTDPIGYADSMNLYQYCGNNPVNWIDPFGNEIFLIIGQEAAYPGIGDLIVESLRPAMESMLDLIRSIPVPDEPIPPIPAPPIAVPIDAPSGKDVCPPKPSQGAKDAADRLNRGEHPGEGWVKQGGDKGGYYNKNSRESLRPDDSGHGPHVDWIPKGKNKGGRIYPDGRFEPKTSTPGSIPWNRLTPEQKRNMA